MVWLPDSEIIMKVRLLVLTECTNVTDGHTDGRTHRWTPHDSIGRACIASRGKNKRCPFSIHNVQWAKKIESRRMVSKQKECFKWSLARYTWWSARSRPKSLRDHSLTRWWQRLVWNVDTRWWTSRSRVAASPCRRRAVATSRWRRSETTVGRQRVWLCSTCLGTCLQPADRATEHYLRLPVRAWLSKLYIVKQLHTFLYRQCSSVRCKGVRMPTDIFIVLLVTSGWL